MYCPNCACELPAIAKFCVRCGAKTGFAAAGFGAQPGSPTPVSESNAGGDHAYCGRCGAKSLPGNQFCTKCGNALPANNAPEQTALSAQSIAGDDGMAVSPKWPAPQKPHTSEYEIVDWKGSGRCRGASQRIAGPPQRANRNQPRSKCESWRHSRMDLARTVEQGSGQESNISGILGVYFHYPR